jgi:2-polyprenyl-6-methoxyphenol hydroxylase-like FAD-dependent oxidoreductase
LLPLVGAERQCATAAGRMCRNRASASTITGSCNTAAPGVRPLVAFGIHRGPAAAQEARRRMDAQSGAGPHGSAPPPGRVHVLGAGPVGLLLTALLQPLDWAAVRLYEKRRDYTRTRMVRLASYLVADSVEAYRADHFDGDNVEAVFDPSELAAALAFRQSIPADLTELLRGWTRGFIQLNAIERALSDLIDARTETPVERVTAALTAEEATAMLEPGDVLIDCTGSKSLLRDGLLPDGDGNTLNFLFEHALVVTFLYSQTYTCNEYCKYYKNVENAHYKFIPMVSRVSYDGTVSHVTGIVTITPEEYAAMPKRFDGEWLRDNLPDAARSMERFIAKVTEETQGEVVGDLEMIPIPLNLYRARNATSLQWSATGPRDHPFATTPVFLLGDSAIGSPYFQSITLGFECAMFLAGLIAQRDGPAEPMLDRYERHMYKQWLRVYMQSKMIKNNKDLFQSLDDPHALLDKLHIY